MTIIDRISAGRFDAYFNREGHRHGPIPDPLKLSYSAERIKEHGKRQQSRLLCRKVLKPELNISNYICSALIDYVEFKLTTKRDQHWYEVQSLFAEVCNLADKPRVVGPDDELDYYGNEFYIRVQDPNAFILGKNAGRVAGRFLGKITVCELEVAVDFRPTDHTDESGQLFVGLMTLHYLPKEGMVQEQLDSMRCVKYMKGTTRGFVERNTDWLDQSFVPPKDGSRPMSRPKLESYIKVDRTMRVGNDKAEEQIRIRHKESNKRSGGSATKLPPEKRRARIESTL